MKSIVISLRIDKSTHKKMNELSVLNVNYRKKLRNIINFEIDKIYKEFINKEEKLPF